MILLFKVGGVPLFIGVGRRRELSVAAPITNFNFVLVKDLSKLKDFSDSELESLRETERRVAGFKNLLEVKKYVVDEMSKVGCVFKREATKVDVLLARKL